MINCGIIGFGKMGQTRFKAISESTFGTVVAVHEPTKKYPGVTDEKRFDSPDDLIADPSIDAVFICTPNYLNKPLTVRALQAGKHVFCEKPPAFTAQEIEEVMEVEKSSGKKLMYGFNHRHHDSIIKAKEMVDSGQYGKLLWMRGRYGKSVDKSFYDNWRSKRALAGGGILIDQGIHMLDLFLMMAGNFEEVHAFVSNLYWKLEVEDNVFGIFKNKDGVVASLHSTMTQWRHLFSLEMFMEKGYVVINGLLTSTKSYGRETMTIAKNRSKAPAATWSDEEHVYFDINNSWKYETDHFLKAIAEKKPVLVGTSADAHKLMTLIDRVYQNPRHVRRDNEREGLAV